MILLTVNFHINDELKAVVNHALTAKSHIGPKRKGIGIKNRFDVVVLWVALAWIGKTLRPRLRDETRKIKPSIYLALDQSIYLMSNGVVESGEKQPRVYAEGLDPAKDDGWRDRVATIKTIAKDVHGEKFCLPFPADYFAEMIDKGADQVIVHFHNDHMTVKPQWSVR